MEKQINLIKPLAMLSLVAASYSTFAGNGTITFKTATAASIVENEVLSFGNSMAVASGTACQLVPLLKKDAAQNRLEVDLAGTTYGGLACGASASGVGNAASYVNADIAPQMGVYEIAGIRGQSVKVEIVAPTTGALIYTPAGQYYPGSIDIITEADPSTPTVVGSSGTAGAVTLGTYQSLVAGQPHPKSVGTIVMGGILTANERLETSKTYDLTYTLNVTYQ